MKQSMISCNVGWKWSALGALGMGLFLVGCGGNEQTTTGAQTGGEGGTETAADYSQLSGQIKGDGSSTVFPISEAVAEEFRTVAPNVQVTVGISGTGGGFKKFAAGDTVLQNASRQIKEKEAEAMKGKEFIELPVAYDGLAVVVNPKNDWATCLTVEELKKIWEPGSKVNNWNQVRAGFPDRPIKLYGAGTDSGTFDYFTDAINGEEGASRSDYTASEDDNTLVQGVSRDVNSIGYFGLAYYEENKDKLKLVAVDGGDGCVEPNTETVSNGTYAPLSRPLFVYLRKDAANRPELQGFVDFFLDNVTELAGAVGYVAMPEDTLSLVRGRWQNRVAGTMYKTDADKKKSLNELLGEASESAGGEATTGEATGNAGS